MLLGVFHLESLLLWKVEKLIESYETSHPFSHVSSDFIKFQFTKEKTICKDQRAFEKFSVILFLLVKTSKLSKFTSNTKEILFLIILIINFDVELSTAAILHVSYFFTLNGKIKQFSLRIWSGGIFLLIIKFSNFFPWKHKKVFEAF